MSRSTLLLLLLTCLWLTTGCTASPSGMDPEESISANQKATTVPQEHAGASKGVSPNPDVERSPFNETFNVALLKKKRVPAPRGEDDVLEDISTRTLGNDWPTFLGPNRNNSSTEKGIITDWSEGKLKILKKMGNLPPRTA